MSPGEPAPREIGGSDVRRQTLMRNSVIPLLHGIAPLHRQGRGIEIEARFPVLRRNFLFSDSSCLADKVT
jgi:hypothetical protein